MITVNLDSSTENKFQKLLGLYKGNYNDMFKGFLQYKIIELKRGIRNIEMDFTYFEQKYDIPTKTFYRKFSNGEIEEHYDDYLKWSGEYEVCKEFKNELKLLI